MAESSLKVEMFLEQAPRRRVDRMVGFAAACVRASRVVVGAVPSTFNAPQGVAIPRVDMGPAARPFPTLTHPIHSSQPVYSLARVMLPVRSPPDPGFPAPAANGG